MAGFAVAPEELSHAVQTIRGLGEELAASPVLRYGVDLAQVGDQRLAVAMAELRDASRDTAALLEKTTEATANRLADTAAAYRELDDSLADSIGTAT